MMKMHGLICALWLLTGCAMTTVKTLTEEFEHISGTLVAPPQFAEGNERLFLYVKIVEQIENKEVTIVAVAENTEEKKILQDLANKLNDAPNEPIWLYGTKNAGQWNEYVTGVDFVVSAVGVYIPQTKAYRIVLTDFGERGQDAIRSASWGGFVRLIGKAAMKAL